MQYVPPATPGVDPNHFGAGKGGFQDGDPTTGTQGTELTAALFNDLLGNLMAVVEAAGIVATPGRTADLPDSIKTLNQIHGQCVLRLVSNVALVLAPYGGNIIRCNGRAYQIPAGGVAIPSTNVEISGVPNGNLAASTVYLVYVKDDGTNTGVLVPSFWPVAGGHVTDTTAGNVGVEVRSNAGAPDSTRTLIGMVGTDAASHFVDADGNRLVLSWFNRQRKASRTFTGSGPTTASTTLIELSTSVRSNFLVWSGAIVDFSVTAISSSGATNSEPITSIGFDGVVADLASVSTQAYQGGAAGSVALSGAREGLAEGQHYATPLGGVNSTYIFSVTWGSLHQTIVVNG